MSTPTEPAGHTDPYLWLEEVDSPEALDWVRTRSDAAVAELGSGPRAQELYDTALGILDATDRLPWTVLRGGWAYNVWRDAGHPRGLWRRIPWTVLAAGAPAGDDPRWEVLLDVDALAADEGEDWVYAGTTVHRVPGEPDRRVLVRLSRGGADAVVVREFDLDTGRFVPAAEGGFELDESKCSVAWYDADTVLLAAPLESGLPAAPLESGLPAAPLESGLPAAPLGNGEAGDREAGDATDSGYARLVRLWRRRTDPRRAPVVFSGERGDVAVSAHRDARSGRVLVSRALDFYRPLTLFWAPGADPLDGPPTRLRIAEDCEVSSSGGWLALLPRGEVTVAGRTHPGGSVLLVPWSSVDQDGAITGGVQEVFSPTPSTALADLTWGRDRVLLTLLEDTESRVVELRPAGDGTWTRRDVEGLPEHTSIDVLSCDALAAGGADQPGGDDALLAVSGPIVPPSMMLLPGEGPARLLGSSPARFDTTGVSVTRHRAVSEDGTEVPYTVIRGPGGDGPRPTILYGYGGFEVPMRPAYEALRGALWVARGGTYVVAGIRGGGEYGPRWHRAALRENRPRAFEDFAAVARALVDEGLTTPAQLGATGGSNGGLLMGVMLTRYPELFGAIVAAVPLLDMRRYHLLLAGASWMAEYGDPDSADWAEFLGAYSPYQNLDAGRPYPPILLTSSTRDDRVHPGHARKMVAALEADGRDVTYYENTEGGHAGAADNAQAARKAMLTYEFFARRL